MTNWFAYCVSDKDVVTIWPKLRYSQAKWRNDWLQRRSINYRTNDMREFGMASMQADGTPPMFCHPLVRAALLKEKCN